MLNYKITRFSPSPIHILLAYPYLQSKKLQLQAPPLYDGRVGTKRSHLVKF